MDHERSLSVPQRLHYLKCIRCRKDKKKCLPVDRPWPHQKCDRCARCNYACSPSMTAMQERQLHQIVSSNPPPSGVPQQDRSAMHEIQMPSEEVAGGAFLKPKCAVYFRELMRARWRYFGIAASSLSIPALGPADLRMRDYATHLYFILITRLNLVELGRKYTEIPEGVTREETAGVCDSRQLIFQTGSEGMSPGNQLQERRIHETTPIREIITLGLGLKWKTLLDAIGVPEVLLLSFEDAETEWEDTPISDIRSVNSEELPSVLSKLLSPTLRLKETCLKLSGVVHMLHCLEGLGESELRTFLAEEIERRVRDVFGNPEGLPGCSGDSEGEGFDDDDESMADAEPMQNVDVDAFDRLGDIGFTQFFGNDSVDGSFPQLLFSNAPELWSPLA